MTDDVKESFDKFERKIDEILNILKGKEGEPGLCEKQREIEKRIIVLEEKPVRARTIIAWTIGVFVGMVNIAVLIKSFFIGK